MPSNTDDADRADPRAFADRLFEPVDAASLAFFRVGFGLILLIEVIRYLAYGWVRALWIEPSFRFTYPGFGWIAPWPGNGMLAHYAVLGLLAALMAIGLFYRAAAALFCLGYTYVFLLDQTAFVNHFYLMCVLAGLMACVPAHAAGSIESRFRSGVASRTVPAWSLWLLRFQIGAVYVFGGLAKLNADWLRGEPVRSAFLARRVDEPIIGWFAQQEWFVWFVAYGGLCFDLFIVPLLLWRRTRVWAFGAAVVFHALNIGVIGFNIGLFPLLMLVATTLFFDPSWPRRVGAWWRGGAASVGASAHAARRDVSPRRRAVIVALLGCWIAIQIVLPLRHLIYPGRVAWTEEGSRFAWHMMLRHKRAETWAVVGDPVARRSWVVDPRTMMSHPEVLAMSGDAQRTSAFLQRVRQRLDRAGRTQARVRAQPGFVRFTMHDAPEAEGRVVDLTALLTPLQMRVYFTDPDYLWQLAQRIAALAERRSGRRPTVRCEAWVSLNARSHQLLIDPEIDLASQPRYVWSHAPWIRPLNPAASAAGPGRDGSDFFSGYNGFRFQVLAFGSSSWMPRR